MALIEIRNIEKIYGTGDNAVRALDGVSLDIDQGQFTVIEGPSGSGKTTLLNMVGCLDEPSRGSITLNGRTITGLSEKERAGIRLTDIGFVFQAYNLVPVLSARENIEYVLVLQKVDKAERIRLVNDVAERLGIASLLDKRPGNMSGGQQQRVAVARAIVGKPALVLADEPTANLDSATGQNLMDMMANLNRDDGITFLISSHDPMVIDMARRKLTLKDGAIAGDHTRA